MDIKYITVNGKTEIDYCYKEISTVLENVPYDLVFEVQFRVAETSTNAASTAVKDEFELELPDTNGTDDTFNNVVLDWK